MRFVLCASLAWALVGTAFSWDNPLASISREVPAAVPAAECPADGVKAVWIDGEEFEGRKTRFFAYYALPEGASAKDPVPGMVLVHGGVGTAYASWVRTWVKRGYAAIAADNCGAIPKKVEGSKWDWAASGVGGPRGWGRTDLADRPPQEQWPYHAVATAIRSHSFLRSLPEVDAERTGITGISWGGFLTMLTAGTDGRFKFAAPVYACAFYEGTNCRRGCKDERLWARWHDLWDPRPFVRNMKMPVVWSASTTDFFFPFDCLEQGFDLLPSVPQLAVRVGMKHSHGPAGENVPEIFQTADRILRNGRDMPQAKSFSVKDGRISASFDIKGRKTKGFDLCWTASDGDWRNRKWEVRRTLSAAGDFMAELPADARAAFVNLVLDEPTGEGMYPESVVSTKAWFRPVSTPVPAVSAGFAAVPVVRRNSLVLTRPTVVTTSAQEIVIQEGPVSNLCWGASWAGITVNGEARFRGGFFAGKNQLKHKGYPFVMTVKPKARCWIEENPVVTPGVDFKQSQPGEVHLGVAGNQYRDWYVQMGTLVCEAQNVLNPDRGLVLWKDNHGSGYVGKVDINGYNQNVAELRSTDPKCDPAKQIVNSGSKGVLVAKRYLVNGREMPPGWYGSCVVVPQHDGRFPPKPTVSAYLEYKPSCDVRTIHPRDGVGNFLSKCRAGKAVNVAYFGGSITAMTGWRNLTTDWLRAQYPSATVNEIAASIGGTGSDLGVFRLKKDVLVRNPDLVFVEFAVNDGDKAPRLIWRQMEGIVRQIWRQDPKTDIVFCYTVAGGIFNEYARGSYNRSAAAMEQVADFYGIPSISLGIPAVELFKQGRLVVSRGEFATAVPKEDPNHDRKVRELMAKDTRLLFANDGVHPRPEGHALYLEAVKTAFAEMKGLKDVDHARKLEKSFCPDNWENARVIAADPSFLIGDWRQEQDAKLKGLWRTDKPGAVIRFKFAGSACRIRMCFQPDGGIMKVRVDGKEHPDVIAFDRYSTYVRDGSVTVFDGDYGLHDVELTLSDREPDRTILSSQFADPKAELAKPKYHGTVFRLRELMLIGSLIGNRTLEVSPNGLSPQKALLRIREAKASGDTSAWTVNVKPGVYSLDAPLIFTPADSGTKEAPVVWRGEGEACVLSGAMEVRGWTDTGKGWWEAPIPKGADGRLVWFEQLWTNGRRASNSRWPKSGFFVPGECGQEVKTEGSGKGVRHRTSEFLTVTDKALKGILDRTPTEELPYVHLRVHQKWSATWRPLAGWDGSRLQTVGTAPWSWSSKWNEEAIYSLANLRAGFASPGDWFYDRKAEKVLYRPRPGERPETFVAHVPRPGLSTVVAFAGEPGKGRYVDHIRFERLAFSGSDATAIEGEAGPTTWYNAQSAAPFDGFVDAVGARNVRFSDCSVRHTGNHALRFRDGCFSNRFERCVFEDIGAGGLWIGADDLRFAKDEKYAIARREVMTYSPSANAFNAVVDCIVCDGGHVNPSGSAIVIGHASDCLVEHCEIADFYYTGISVGWQWAYRPTAAMRNVIRFNRIHDFGKGVLSDMGGVYTLGTAFGTRVTDNVIYNVKSRTYGGWGLYADEGTEGVVFERNLVYNTHDGGFHQHYGAGNIVRNNIFAWNEQNGVIRTIRANVFNVRSSLDVVNNIVLTERGDLASYGVLGVEGVWANNVWWSTTGEAKLCGLKWEDWEKTGKESNGRFADPKFVDAKNFDFRLKADSPALSVGFRPFDFSRAGVTSAMKGRL